MFALLLMAQMKIWPFLSLIYSGFVLIAIFLTYSRAVWLTLAACLVGYSLFSRRLWLSVIITGVCLVVFLGSTIQDRMEDITQKKVGQTTSLDMRYEITESLLKVFPQKPLIGFGLGTSQQLVETYTKYHELPPHNDYIRILVETGGIGFLSFVIFLFSLYTIPLSHLNLFISNIHLKTFSFMILFITFIILGTNHLGNVSTMGIWFALLGIVYRLFEVDLVSNKNSKDRRSLYWNIRSI